MILLIDSKLTEKLEKKNKFKRKGGKVNHPYTKDKGTRTIRNNDKQGK